MSDRITNRSEHFIFKHYDAYLGKPLFMYPTFHKYRFNYNHGILISVIRDIEYHLTVMRKIEQIHTI